MTFDKDNMEIVKSADEVRQALRQYREYACSDEFLDAMDANAEGIVAGLAQYEKDMREVKEIIHDYVYGACTGLEEAEGDIRFILYPKIAYTVDGVLSALGIPVKLDSKEGK